MPFGIPKPFKGRQPGNTPTAPPAAPPSAPQQGPTTGPLGGQDPHKPPVQKVQNGNVSLITFSPEELLRQVEERRNSVSFGLSGPAGRLVRGQAPAQPG